MIYNKVEDASLYFSKHSYASKKASVYCRCFFSFTITINVMISIGMENAK